MPPRDRDREFRRRADPTGIERQLRDRKTLPHNRDVEASILGGVILHNEALALVPDIETEDFYDHRHRVVWEGIRNLEAAGTPIDVVTLENEIEKAGKLEAIGGMAFLGELALRVPTVDNVEAYAKTTKQHAITRAVIITLSTMIDEGLTGLSEGEQLVQDVTTALMHIKTGGEVKILTLAELIAEEAVRLEADVNARANGEHVFTGVPTGITALDERVGGNPVGIMSMVIARPGMGKSTIAMQYAKASKRIADEETLLASYEDSGQSFGQRGLAQESGFATDLIRARRLHVDDIVGIAAVHAAKHDRSEGLLPAAGMTVEQLARRMRRENIRRRAAGKKPYKQLIVDYIQKMPMPDWSKSRDDGISYISTTLCTVAAQESMAVVSMCQLNREVEKRDDHRPRLSDIRDSGSLEQDGKFICGLYHPHSYDQEKYPDHELHLLVLKNHQGENNADIPLFWDRKTHALHNTQLEYHYARTRHA
jgi:replicative DNA helicase